MGRPKRRGDGARGVLEVVRALSMVALTDLAAIDWSRASSKGPRELKPHEATRAPLIFQHSERTLIRRRQKKVEPKTIATKERNHPEP